MQIGISNLGWCEKDIHSNTTMALDCGFDYIESAYSKVLWSKSIFSIQSIFYNSGIESFSDQRCIDYLFNLIDYCLNNNIKVITFGSPSMRVGEKSAMLKLLSELDGYIQNNDCIICVEPNARKYGGTYYYSLDEIVSDIYHMKNIKTMIDTGNLALEGFNSINEYEKHKDYIHHTHISTPNLEPIDEYSIYIDIVSSMKSLGYNKSITYEYVKSYNFYHEINLFINNIKTLCTYP